VSAGFTGWYSVIGEGLKTSIWMQGEDRLYMRRYSKHSWTVVAFNERPAKPRHKKLAGPFPDLDSAKVAFLLIRSAL